MVGDIFDQADTVHVPTLLALRDLLGNWPGQVFVLAGNHDQTPAGRAVIEALSGPSRVKLVTQPQSAPPVGPLVPYCRAPEDFAAAIEALSGAPGPPLLWCHQGFRGAYMNGLRRDTHGLPLMALPPERITIAGHYHPPQNLGRLVYCGSPYEVSFAEEGQIKGWLSWEDPEANPVPVRVPFGDLGAPRHFTVWWDPEQGSPVRPDGVRPGDRVRVKTRASKRVIEACRVQLEDAGLSAAPIQGGEAAYEGRGLVGGEDGPLAAALQYATRVHGGRGTLDPAELLEAAEAEGLWAGL